MGKKGFKRSRQEDDSEEEVEEKNEALMELEAAKQIMMEQQRALAEASKQKFIYNKEGLVAREACIGLETLPWPETLIVDDIPVDFEGDVHDDLAREMAFYQNALDGVKLGRKKLRDANVPYQRPEDFFAEMIKSDAHMDKIKDKLIFEKKKMEAFEARKQREEQRQFHRAAGAERQKERAAKKKETLDRVAQWRKQNKDRGGGLLDDDGLAAALEGQGKGGGGGGRKNGKRRAADKKYGHSSGNPYRMKNKNDKKSLNDFRDFGKGKKGGGGGGKKQNAGKSRPGKAARANKRARKG